MSRSADELRPDSLIKDLSEEAASQLLQELAEIIAYHDARYLRSRRANRAGNQRSRI